MYRVCSLNYRYKYIKCTWIFEKETTEDFFFKYCLSAAVVSAYTCKSPSSQAMSNTWPSKANDHV